MSASNAPILLGIYLFVDDLDASIAFYRCARLGVERISDLRPCDPPWQARFASVDDPDGNPVGLHSPRDRAAERGRERPA